YVFNKQMGSSPREPPSMSPCMSRSVAMVWRVVRWLALVSRRRGPSAPPRRPSRGPQSGVTVEGSGDRRKAEWSWHGRPSGSRTPRGGGARKEWSRAPSSRSAGGDRVKEALTAGIRGPTSEAPPPRPRSSPPGRGGERRSAEAHLVERDLGVGQLGGVDRTP